MVLQVRGLDLFKAGLTEENAPLSEVEDLSLFKGSGKEGVVSLAVLETYNDGHVRVAERFVQGDGRGYCEYVKPVSELLTDVSKGVIEATGKTAPSRGKIRSTLSR